MTSGSLRMPAAAAFASITAAICLGPAFLTGSWFLPTAVGVLLVGAGCEVARRMAVDRATVPLGGLVALVLYLLLRYGNDQALFGIVPWTGSVDRLGQLFSGGRADINRYAAPIGVSPGVELITVAGVGLVALAVDTLAVTWRRAALAGLPLLVLYTVPTAIAPDGVSWVAFALCGIAFLTLLLAESRERVSRWGRPMRYSVARENYRPEVDTGALSQVGRRVGAAALGLALVVPAVMPEISAGALGFGDGGFGSGSGGDGRKVTVINPILDLGANLRQGENRLLIRYRGSATYLRLVGLDQFTGDKWQPSALEVSRDNNDVEKGLAHAPGLGSSVPTTKRSYRIEVFDLDQTWLPLPYPSTKVSDISGTWLYDPSTFNVFGENSSTRQITYRVSALEVNPTPEQLAAAAASVPPSLRRYLRLPPNMDPLIAATAQQVVRGATSNYDRALALQNWLRDPQEFTYSQTLDSSGPNDGNGTQAIATFLQTRRGYCVQFASTMAVMARWLGIPARVAVGFASGTEDDKGRHMVGVHDAHAWPELYFQGVGWVPFEPTPGGPASAPPPYARQSPGGGGPNSQPTSQPGSTPTGSTSGLPGSENRARQDVLEGNRRGGGGTVGAGPVQLPVLPTLVTFGVLLLLGVPSLTRLLVRRRRWQDARTPTAQALAAWADLKDTLVDHGYAWNPSDPPRRGAARLASERHLVGEPADALHRVATATERARYAPEMTPVGDLRGDVDAVRAGLAEGSGRWARWRARVLPRSTRAVAHAVADRMADGLDAVDAAFSTLGRRLRPRRT